MVTVHVFDTSLHAYAKENGYTIKSVPALRAAVKKNLAEFADTALQQAFEQARQDGYVIDLSNANVTEEHDNEQDEEE